MAKTIFQIMGIVMIGGAGLMVLLSLVSLKIYPPSGQSHMGYVRVGLFVITSVIVGWGLYNLKKWAALIFSAFALFLGYWMVKFGLQDVPGHDNRIGLVFALLLLAPLLMILKFWGTLRWK